MNGRAGATRLPKSLTYALALNLFYGAVIFLATVIAYVVTVVIEGHAFYGNDNYVFVHLNIIYALLIFLMALIVQSLAGRFPDLLDRFAPDGQRDTFFSRGFILLIIRLMAAMLILFGTALFFLMMYGLSRFAFPSAG